MSTDRLEEQIKTRVPEEVKRGLEQIAKHRHLDLSDIAREAFREFLSRNDPGQLELVGDNGKKAV